MRLKYIFFLLLTLLLVSCSKDDEVTNPTNDELITGKWKMEFYITTGNQTDSLKCTMDLAGRNGTFTGTGDLTYGGSRGTTSFLYKIKDDATGTYSETAINVTLKSAISGDTYNFTGSRDTQISLTTRYKGKVTMTAGGKTEEFLDNYFYKSYN